MALNAGRDAEILAIELRALIELEFDVTLTGFSLAEIDFTLDQAFEASTEAPDNPADRIPEPTTVAVSRAGERPRPSPHRFPMPARTALAPRPAGI